MGISTEFSNTTYPISWTDSVKRNNSLTFTLFQCNRWAPGHTCEFDAPPASENHTMIGRIEDDKCSKCDKGSGMCKACDCAEGGECMDAKKCVETCGAPADKYKCTWNATNPQCVTDPDGTLTKDECTDQCHDAAYGKCDFDKNTCVTCKPANTPGGDPDCLYLMSYCVDI